MTTHGSQAQTHDTAAIPATAEYAFIDTRAGLEAYLDSVSPATLVYMDLEADNLHHYREQLCLIQLHAGGKTALVDPLSIDSCQALLQFIDEPGRQLWMHGADFDMTLMLAAFDWLPDRIYDTQIAAQLVGRRQFGLAALVHHYLGLEMSKSSQKEDWSRRPLTQRMLEYAAFDASVLVPIRQKLIAELDALGRWDWFMQGCTHTRRQALTRPPRDEDQIWRVQGWGGLKGRELAFLRALWFWREDEAQRRDVPTFKVVSNQDLLVLAAQMEAEGHADVRRKLTREAREDLRDLIAGVRALPQSGWPHRTKAARRHKPVDFDARYDALKAHRDKVAHELGIDPVVVANRRNLEILAGGSGPDEKPNLLPWQRQALGLADA